MIRNSFLLQNRMLSTSKSLRSRPKHRARLPIPALRDTLNRYLRSLEPFLLEDEARGGMSFHSAYALREKWAHEFEDGIGKTLQERLIALDKVSPNNWLDDNFWINKAYLEWRAPLLIDSNWWLAFFEDPLIPRSALSGETNNNRVGITFWQIRRAAWLIHRILQFKDNVLESQESDSTTLGSWLLENVSKLFNIARIPEPYCDTLSKRPHPSSPAYRSILLMLHDWCYSVAVYHPPSSDSTKPKLLSPGEIEARIRAVVLDVEQRIANGEKPLLVGALSADERDRWAANLQHLLSLSPMNLETHQAMLHSIMGLSLEHTTYIIPPPPPTLHPTYVHTGTPAELTVDSHLHTIRGTMQNVSNRFYDKAFTLIVDPSTRAGASGEHSPVDALVPSIVAEYGIVQGVDAKAFEHHGTENREVNGQGWKRLDWIGDEVIEKECNAAVTRAQKIIENSDDSVLWFRNFGSDWIKSINKFSPDAFIQMALQLAWYRQRGEFTATYETVLTRMFKNGRTETLRTFSNESRAWVLGMEDPSATLAERFKLLQHAISSHSHRTREAMTGRGFDRHLLGLQLLLRPLNGESASLFEDELYDRSTEWKLSTSGLSAGLLFKGTGFGTMYENGYGINYLAAPEMVKFGIESKYSSPLTSTQEFKEAISNALLDMQTLCQAIYNEKYLGEVVSHL